MQLSIAILWHTIIHIDISLLNRWNFTSTLSFFRYKYTFIYESTNIVWEQANKMWIANNMKLSCRHVKMYMVKRYRTRPVTDDPFIDAERSRRDRVESEDEDLNKCRDLVASDDGCDLARRGKQLQRAKRTKRNKKERDRESKESNEKTTQTIGIDIESTCTEDW